LLENDEACNCKTVVLEKCSSKKPPNPPRELLSAKLKTTRRSSKYRPHLIMEIPKQCKAGVVINEGPNFHVEVQMVDVPEPGKHIKAKPKRNSLNPKRKGKRKSAFHLF
jgi:hypothetical protein